MEGVSSFEAVLSRLAEAVRREAAFLGLEVSGELRGLIQEPGHPETANGFVVSVGGGLPPGWVK